MEYIWSTVRTSRSNFFFLVHISLATCLWAFEKFSKVMPFDWKSTRMNIAIDRHLKRSLRLILHSSVASAAVLLKLDFEASLDLHIEEQLRRICRCCLCFLSGITFWDAPYAELYRGLLLEHPGTAERLPMPPSCWNAPVAVLNVARAFLTFFFFFYMFLHVILVSGMANMKPRIRLSERPQAAI